MNVPFLLGANSHSMERQLCQKSKLQCHIYVSALANVCVNVLINIYINVLINVYVKRLRKRSFVRSLKHCLIAETFA